MAAAKDDNLLTFDVAGPVKVPCRPGERGGRFIAADDGPEFFELRPEFADERGCYVFALRSGGGITPWCVG